MHRSSTSTGIGALTFNGKKWHRTTISQTDLLREHRVLFGVNVKLKSEIPVKIKKDWELTVGEEEGVALEGMLATCGE